MDRHVDAWKVWKVVYDRWRAENDQSTRFEYVGTMQTTADECIETSYRHTCQVLAQYTQGDGLSSADLARLSLLLVVILQQHNQLPAAVFQSAQPLQVSQAMKEETKLTAYFQQQNNKKSIPHEPMG